MKKFISKLLDIIIVAFVVLIIIAKLSLYESIERHGVLGVIEIAVQYMVAGFSIIGMLVTWHWIKQVIKKRKVKERKEITLAEYSKFVSSRYKVKTIIREENKGTMHEGIISKEELDERLEKYNDWNGFIVSVEMID